ncbi:MAG: zf-HC2 domain-containing protein [Candidatus Poribacteria bacterium]|nr:zf-HC2 domain-containing protein [Candidatus Poribacteria bacterium]
MKPRCRSAQRYLSDYIDCTLSGRQTVIVAQHLRSCKACQRELESLRRAKTLLHLYVYPSPPEGYHDQFWGQLQHTIETHPRTVWWRTAVLSDSFAWRFQEFLNWPICFFGGLVSLLFGRVKLAPVYVWMLCVVLASLFAYQFLQPQDQNHLDLRVYPADLMSEGGNRELISNRDRLAGISRFFPEVFRNRRPSRRIDAAESAADSLATEANLSRFVSHNDPFKAPVVRDGSPDLMTVAQLSSPGPIAASEDFFQPLSTVISPLPAKIGWGGNRSLNGFVDMLMNVPLPNLSITEVYDSVKL